MNRTATSGGTTNGAEHLVDVDLDDHPDGVGTHRSIPPFVGPYRLGDHVGVSRDDRRSFDGEPGGPGHLADGRPPNPFDVAHLLGAVRRDDSHDSPVEVDGERNRNHVGGAVGAKRGQGRQMSIGEKPSIGRVELVQRSSHAHSAYRGSA